MSRQERVWLITGVSRGLGRALATVVLASGDIVIGTTRTGAAGWGNDELKLTVIPLELTDLNSVQDAVVRAYALHGRLDVVLNNAGYGLLGAVEEASSAEADHVFAVNFLGPLVLIEAVLPLLRKQRCGHLVNVSSIAGLAPMAGSGMLRWGEVCLGRRVGDSRAGIGSARNSPHSS